MTFSYILLSYEFFVNMNFIAFFYEKNLPEKVTNT